MFPFSLFIIGDVNVGLPKSNFQLMKPVKQSRENRLPPSVLTNKLSLKIIGPENILLWSKFIFHKSFFSSTFKQ